MSECSKCGRLYDERRGHLCINEEPYEAYAPYNTKMHDKKPKPLDRGKVLTEIEDEIDYWDKQEGGTAALIALKDLRVAINSGRLDVEEG